MLAERLNVCVTRTSKRLALVLALIGGAVAIDRAVTRIPLLAFVPAAEARDLTYKTTREAFEQGLGAYRSGYYEIAIPAFEYVIARNDPQRFFAEFYLGRILADNAGSQTDHAKAYMFFQRIADENADIDPDDLKKAPFVAKALTAVAIYVRDGIAEIALKPDEQRAIEYLRHAATFFNEPDAQFELAKIFIGSEADRPAGLHYLQKLSKEGHPGAQAVLADLLARGKFIKQDHAQALGLIKVAVENAGASERIWIEDIYQNIFCASPKDARERSKSLVATWRKMFAAPRASVEQPMGLGRRGDITATRVCSNGERLDLPQQGVASSPAVTTPPSQGVTSASQPQPVLGLMPGGGSPVGGTQRPPQR